MTVRALVIAVLVAFSLLACTESETPVAPISPPCPGSLSALNGAWKDGAIAAVTLSYDDGDLSQLNYALPQLEAHGFRGTFNITAGIINDGVNGRTWNLWRSVYENGHEIGNHTYHHVRLTEVPLDSARWEIEHGKQAIEDSLGNTVTSFVYPNGASNPDIQSIVAEGHECARGTGGFNTTSPPDPMLLASKGAVPCEAASYKDAVDTALAHGWWVVLIFHGLKPDPTSPYNCQPAVHDSVLDYVASKGDSVWVAPLTEIFRWTRGTEVGADCPPGP